MRYLFQLLRILLFCFLGEALHRLLPLPVPASIYGLALLLLALKAGVVRLDQVKETGNFLTGIFPVLFIPGAVGVMELWDVLGRLWLPILLALIPVTILVFAVSGRVTQRLAGRRQHD
ncbi:MAG: CidA/LrgA family protein [Aristaeellaceae bacterium]